MSKAKEEIITLKDKYLDSVISEIPENAIIYKKTTGIGATTLEITNSKRNSIIIEPNVPVIEGKTDKYKDLLGIYEGTNTSDIINYMQNESIPVKKLMSTPESFEKIKKAFYMLDIDIYKKDYFLLFDESHKLTSEINFRETISLPMQDFWKFEKRSLISATPTNFIQYPIFQKYGFRNIIIEPQGNHSLKVNLYTSNNILQDIIHYLENCGDENRKICFFINSVDIILSIIKTLQIEDESNVYCANRSIEKLKRKGLKNVSSKLEELNIYNFYTSRFFSAVDIITEDIPHIVVISDALKAPQTMIEPLLESRQIAGRFRNGISSFTHIAGLDNKLHYKTSKELTSFLEEQQKAYLQLQTLYESAIEEGVRTVMKEALERVEISKYLEEDMSFNYFMRENLFDTESAKEKYISWENFVLSYTVNDEFFEVEKQNNNIYIDNKERLKTVSNNNRQLRKQIVHTFFDLELDNENLSEEQKEELLNLKRLDEFIVEICQNFNKEFIIEMNYSKQRLNLALIKKKSKEKSISFPVIDAILQSFKIGIAYTESEIINTLKLIFEEFSIDKSPKATDIKDYFETSNRRTVKRKDKYLKGYKLLKPKFETART